MLRSLAKTAVAGTLRCTGADRLVGLINGSKNTPLVVGYHRVVEDFQASAKGYIPAMLVSRKMLARHLDWIGRRFRFITLDELGARLTSGEPFREPVAAITFDDGYSDVYHNAFPLLKQKGIPAAIFVVTGLAGSPALQLHDLLYFLLARAFSVNGRGARNIAALLRGLRKLTPGIGITNGSARGPVAAAAAVLSHLPQAEVRKIVDSLRTEVRIEEGVFEAHRSLTWEMISEMHRAGITIGAHTATHAVLTNERPEKVRAELAGSRRELQERLGASVDHFAYPDGRFNAVTIKAAAVCGYRFGYTTCSHRDHDYPLLTIPRVLLWENSYVDALGRFSEAVMSCYVNGIFDLRSRCSQDHGEAVEQSERQKSGQCVELQE